MTFLKSHKKAFITVLCLICAAIIGVTAMLRFQPTKAESILGYVITPLQGLFSRAANFVDDKKIYFSQIADVQAENALLRRENAALLEENTRLNAVRKQNDILTELFNIANIYSDLPKEAAYIIAKDPGNWYNSYIIDKGERDGFAKNMIVLTGGGLAGKITEAADSYSRVVSLIDDTSSVSAQSERTGDMGFVRGDARLMLEGKCRMELIPAEADIMVGDTIITSRMSSMYPPGILIGTVLSVSADPVGTKTAIIDPFADFKHMETVLVVTKLFGGQE
ncbi:hypothetical protein FACS189490_01870 [Clostridia bacterium]|nr:hypothetical protein FACS189490_01870 [Clostridia bacterium]